MPSPRSFGAHSTASEVVAGLDLSHVAAIVTGASGGLGAETARALAERGARVTLTARDIPKGEAVAEGSASRPATRRSTCWRSS